MARHLSSLLKESEDSGEDVANSHYSPDSQSSHQVYQAVSHGFHYKVEQFFEILNSSSCVMHQLLSSMGFRTKNFVSQHK